MSKENKKKARRCEPDNKLLTKTKKPYYETKFLPSSRNACGMLMYLLFQKSVYDLPAVATEVWMDVRDMYPVVARLGVFLPYQLVKVEMLTDVVEPPAAFLHVTIDAEVCRLSLRML